MTDEFGESRNVISLAEAQGEAVRFPMLQDVESYWDALRGRRAVPDRAEINPRSLQRSLSNCFILERIAPGHARFRLAGTHLHDLMGMEVRGMPLTCFFLPDVRKRVSATLEQVFDGPAKAWLTLAGDRAVGKPPMDACLLLLPLRGESGATNRVIGCLATLGPVGRTPRRFDVRSTAVTQVLGDQALQGEGTAPGDRVVGVPGAASETITGVGHGFAEPARSFRPSPHRPPRTERPHLYLVSTDGE